jgi:hypothetical protein
MQHNIFYSWQSDLPNSCNRGFIQDCLEGVVKDLKSDDAFKNSIVIDRDTSGVSGSPDIGQTIFFKIDKSAVFVCDVSIISDSSAKRQTPNPNVLLELGYALSKLGDSRIIMVMNTVFGGPELSPFDLKQKRIVTYKLSEGESKTEARKILRSSLGVAIKAVLLEHEKLNKATAINIASPSEDLIQAIKSSRPDQARVVHNFMKWLKAELIKLDPSKLPGEPDELLVEAISKTIPLIKEFDKVADTIAAMNAISVAKILIKDFEHILSICYVPVGFSGSYSRTDFDLFKFVINELFIILFGYLLKDEHYSSINSLLKTEIYINNSPIGPTTINFAAFSYHLALLDEVRNKRLVVNNQRRISIHADLLKERHEAGILAENLSWTEFKDADLFLYFYSYANHRNNSYVWWPRTSVYFDWNDPTPRFLVNTTTNQGAQLLSQTLNIKDRKEFPKIIGEAITNLGKGMRQNNLFAEPLHWFDIKTIPTS